jgi:predicted nuclease of predicted toxin-antitoxin system
MAHLTRIAATSRPGVGPTARRRPTGQAASREAALGHLGQAGYLLGIALAVRGGHDAVGLELAEGNRSTDKPVAAAADAEGRVLVTKDGDFRVSHRLRGRPQRLPIITTGTSATTRRSSCSERTSTWLVTALSSVTLVELGQDSVEVLEQPPT